MVKVRDVMEAHGWDNVDFIKGTIEKDDFQKMGIKNEKIKR